MNTGALVFDLDGVIVRTNFVKHAAMLALFSDHPEQHGAISTFILSNGGVPRRVKLAEILRHTLQLEPTETLVADYLDRYAVSLAQQLAVAPMVEGVADFMAGYAGACYVCSSAPEAEVRDQLARRSLVSRFTAVYGGDTPKPIALRAIAALHPKAAVVFFGDSVGDYEAACQAGAAFIGVACERDNFQHLPMVKVRDFADSAAVQHAMLEAISRGAVNRCCKPGSC